MTSSFLKITKINGLRAFSRRRDADLVLKNGHRSKHSYLYGASIDPLRPYTIGRIFNDAVRQNPDQKYLVSRHENKTYTYATIDSEVDKLCRSFNAIGLKRGERIGVWMPNCALYVSLVLAASRLGLIFVNINPAYQSDELKHSLTLVGVKCLVALETFKTQNYPEIIERIDQDIWKRPPNSPVKSKVLPFLETVVFNSENRINGAYNLESFLDLGSNRNYDVPNIQPDEGCNIQFTSGTTGKPKATLLNHFGMVNNINFIMKRLGIHENGNLNTFCCMPPLFHTFGLSIGILGTLITKSTLYFPSAHFEPKAAVDVIIQDKCTFIFGTPTVLVDVIAAFEKLPPEQRNNKVKYAMTGGAPCSPVLIKKFKKTFPGTKLVSVFGMTETSPITFQNYHDDTDEQIMSTVGQIHDHVEAKVVDLNGEMVPFGTPGELLIRGYVNMIGYYNDEEKTKETIDSTKWLKTGDQFMLYENGYGNVVGRTKDMIIRGGENIFPVDIEYFLESHPLITQVQVYGVPDERMGEEVCASVIVKEGSTLTETDIKSYCKGKISHFKVPKYVFIEKGEFPKTGSGKVQKFLLKEIAIKRIAKYNEHY
ncbi:Hypothetical protein CINCED_3A019046 [Cinara cedri]|uniref:Medium-chain acyl-CoA ligase ACSF2, mitochondrial n=1 Tax=Cinara cedri TaxID=506608 RepID=A0A5E4NBI7_9HEMI|nr:Hypothetical protein CINCED_3A019046 [Cinara cedri]